MSKELQLLETGLQDIIKMMGQVPERPKDGNSQSWREYESAVELNNKAQEEFLQQRMPAMALAAFHIVATAFSDLSRIRAALEVMAQQRDLD